MIGVLLVTHGAIGDELLATAAQILGKASARTAVVSVPSAEDPAALLAQARALVAQLDDGSGVLVLTDMYGSTPGNIVRNLLADGRVEGVAGLSLPMLVRVLSGRDRTLAAAVERALSGGTEGVLHMNPDRCRATG